MKASTGDMRTELVSIGMIMYGVAVDTITRGMEAIGEIMSMFSRKGDKM